MSPLVWCFCDEPAFHASEYMCTSITCQLRICIYDLPAKTPSVSEIPYNVSLLVYENLTPFGVYGANNFALFPPLLGTFASNRG